MRDREPIPSAGRTCAMYRQCRIRREDAGCPCDGPCRVDLMAERDAVRFVPPLGEVETRPRTLGAWN